MYKFEEQNGKGYYLVTLFLRDAFYIILWVAR